MNKLIITFISVGNGDSILLEFKQEGKSILGLIDCNDCINLKSTYILLKRFFEMNGLSRNNGENIFDFIILSHAHADHISGLQDVIKTYGVNTVYYSKAVNVGGHKPFFEFLEKSSFRTSGFIKDVKPVNAIYSKNPISIGLANLSIIWPLEQNKSKNENNNSLIIVLEHLNNQFILGGDAEYEVWKETEVIKKLKELKNIKVFKVPHHGASNGTLDPNNNEPTWSNHIPKESFLVISSHKKRYNHPHEAVLKKLSNFKNTLNTAITQDQNIEFTSDGDKVTVKYFQQQPILKD